MLKFFIQLIYFVVQFATVSAITCMFLVLCRAIGKAMKQPVNELAAACFHWPKSFALVPTIWWVCRTFLILIPAICLSLISSMFGKGIEAFVNFLDKGLNTDL